VSAFVPVEFYDYRPAELSLSGLASRHADLLSLPFGDGGVESLSCMHVVEHVGLGRYGDPIDPDGWSAALAELSRIVEPGGRLYLGVPVGRERLEFNAHRVFDPRTIVGGLPAMRLERFDGVDDGDRFVRSPGLDAFAGARFACGLFEFSKL